MNRKGFAIRGLVLAAVGAAAMMAVHCGTDQGPKLGDLVILPADAVVQASSGQQFTAEVEGLQKTVSWYVDGVQGGTPETGLITTDGFYVAPSEVPSGGHVTLRAWAVSDSVLDATTTVEVERVAGAVYVTVSPDTVTLGPGEAITFSSDVFECTTEDVAWSIGRLWGSSSSLGSISADGQYQTPPSFNRDFAVAVRATSFDCPGKIGIAKVLVYAGPKSFSVELEGFTSSYNVPYSLPITASYCGGASDGKAVKGLDNGGEWIRVPVDVPSAGTYEVFLRYQATSGDVLQAKISMEDAGIPTPEADFALAEGEGIG